MFNAQNLLRLKPLVAEMCFAEAKGQQLCLGAQAQRTHHPGALPPLLSAKRERSRVTW